MNGQDIYLDREYDHIFINGSIKVVEANIIATNDVIHKIDQVLLPPDKDIVEIAIGKNPDEFNNLVAAVIEAELVDALKSEEPFTVLAPTDKAFNDLLSSLGISLSDFQKKNLKQY